jgi:two-component system LytT family response regulator
MPQLKTIIVDDEPLALNLIRNYLGKHNDIEIVAECSNGGMAIKRIAELQPDLVFMDIQMPGLTGLDVVKRLQAEDLPLIVFVTAFDQYAVDAFSVHAVDYLLKPFDQTLIDRAIERCKIRLATRPGGAETKANYLSAFEQADWQANYDADPDDYSESGFTAEQDGSLPRLVIKDRGAITFVEQKDIDWVDAAGDYMCVHVQGQTHIMRSTLKNLLAQLSPELFQRVHRSTIVNLSRVTKVIPLAKSEYFLVLGEDEKLKVSRNYKNVVRALIARIEGEQQ